jgi:hypothetical protein
MDERFSATRTDDTPPGDLWQQFFCGSVNGEASKAFLAEAVLPRPRDFLYVVKTAIATAVNRGHARVEQDDILDACKEYSQFAFGILLIEDNSQEGRLEKVLYEFAGASPQLTLSEVRERVAAAGISPETVEKVIAQLCSLSFLGIEVSDQDFRFPDNSTELRKVTVLSRRLCELRSAEPVYLVHHAFWPFLEIGES